ncbi:MAG: hypothetical protein AAF705_07905, partial [Bacteroidota bacterium]
DLCLFITGLFDGKLISRESLTQMKPVGNDSYGFAMYGTPFEDRNGWGHGGNIDAFASDLIYFEESGISIALSCNGSNFGPHDVEIAMLSEVFGQSYDLPSFDFVALTSEELDPYLGTYETDELPMDMIISKDGNTLFLQATGQPASALAAEGDHQFTIMQYGVKMTFDPANNALQFEQQGMTFNLLRKEETTAPDEPVPAEAVAGNDIEQYLGTYTSDLLPIDLTISEQEGQLIGQGEGQPSFPLIAEGEHTYSNKEIGLIITFIPTENKMHFVQGTAMFEMVLED